MVGKRGPQGVPTPGPARTHLQAVLLLDVLVVSQAEAERVPGALDQHQRGALPERTSETQHSTHQPSTHQGPPSPALIVVPTTQLDPSTHQHSLTPLGPHLQHPSWFPNIPQGPHSSTHQSPPSQHPSWSPPLPAPTNHPPGLPIPSIHQFSSSPAPTSHPYPQHPPVPTIPSTHQLPPLQHAWSPIPTHPRLPIPSTHQLPPSLPRFSIPSTHQSPLSPASILVPCPWHPSVTPIPGTHPARTGMWLL